VTNQVPRIATIIAAIVISSFFPSVSNSQAATAGERINEHLYVGEVEVSPPAFRGTKAFHFTLLGSNGSIAACGTGPGARPDWYYVERCPSNDTACIASADAMFQLLMSAKLARLPVSVHAPNCKVSVLHLW